VRTQVAIIGAGPSGLLLSHLLDQQGIDSVVVDNKSKEYVLARIRAGVLETGAVKTLADAGLADRLYREGMEHRGIYLQWPGERVHIDFSELCGGSVWVYGQTEVQKDLIAAREAAGQAVLWGVSETEIVGDDPAQVRVITSDGSEVVIEADYIAGCDGFHGVSRASIPESDRATFERTYPYAWLGILAEVAPSTDELIYAWHPDGFALHSMRSESISRLYIQVGLDADIREWPDDRIWEALATRMALTGWTLQTGSVLEKGITPMRSFVSTPMRHGNLFLAGDAAHIVPPTGAKGLNLAIADVTRLARALGAHYSHNNDSLLAAYSDEALARVWNSTHFSWWMTTMLHTPPDSDPDAAFIKELQRVQLMDAASGGPLSVTLAQKYTGIGL
jgi:p-hydroxybenzoate 3-monooxygenase